MSPIARALTDRFDEVCRVELIRLRRKTASLSEADRTEVEALCVEVTRAISAHVASAAEGGRERWFHDVLGHLFALCSNAGPAGSHVCPAPPVVTDAAPGERP
jgi:hypothetical protein